MKGYYKILIDGMDDALKVVGLVRGAGWGEEAL